MAGEADDDWEWEWAEGSDTGHLNMLKTVNTLKTAPRGRGTACNAPPPLPRYLYMGIVFLCEHLL